MQLIPIENVNAIELFSNEKSIQAVLDEIKEAATDFEPDVSTPDGRKEIAAQAYKVSRSKTVIDNAGKELTQEWAKKKKLVDAGRRLARDFCDDLRDEIKAPLVAYEAEEYRLIQAAAQKAEMEADEIDAYAQNDLIDREAKMAAWEAEQEALEAAKAEKERAEKAAAERAAAAKKMREEAEAKAKREAEAAIEAERQKAIEAERMASEQAEQAERDRIAAEEREQARIKQAEADKQAAIEHEQQRAKDEADRLERDRLRLIADNEREAQARAADTENRRKINNSIVDALVAGGVSQKASKAVVMLVASGKVPAMAIRY